MITNRRPCKSVKECKDGQAKVGFVHVQRESIDILRPWFQLRNQSIHAEQMSDQNTIA